MRTAVRSLRAHWAALMAAHSGTVRDPCAPNGPDLTSPVDAHSADLPSMVVGREGDVDVVGREPRQACALEGAHPIEHGSRAALPHRAPSCRLTSERRAPADADRMASQNGPSACHHLGPNVGPRHPDAPEVGAVSDAGVGLCDLGSTSAALCAGKAATAGVAHTLTVPEGAGVSDGHPQVAISWPRVWCRRRDMQRLVHHSSGGRAEGGPTSVGGIHLTSEAVRESCAAEGSIPSAVSSSSRFATARTRGAGPA